MAGGCALNSVANGRILRETPFEALYVHPAAGDGGAAVGAALYGYTSSSASRAVRDGARGMGRATARTSPSGSCASSTSRSSASTRKTG